MVYEIKQKNRAFATIAYKFSTGLYLAAQTLAYLYCFLSEQSFAREIIFLDLLSIASTCSQQHVRLYKTVKFLQLIFKFIYFAIKYEILSILLPYHGVIPTWLMCRME
jgi:hypothetical protein